jgi:hypothetical protein
MLLEERQRFCRSVLPSDCRLLLFFVTDGKDANWMGFGSRETYLQEGLKLDPEMVELALRGLQLTDPAKAIGYEEAQVLGKRGGDHGNQYTGGKRQVRIANLPKSTQTRAYTIARLKRDRPDLAVRVEADELSANAAAIEAGFRHKPTPFEIVKRQWPKLTPEQQSYFHAH